MTLLGLIVGLAGGCGFGLMASATLSPLIDATDPMAFAPIPATLIAVVGGETKLCKLTMSGTQMIAEYVHRRSVPESAKEKMEKVLQRIGEDMKEIVVNTKGSETPRNRAQE